MSILVPAIIFILWDEFFTRLGVWGFNPRYISGIYMGSLPLEEILFFICIPYACLFTYEALKFLIQIDFLAGFQKEISIALIAASLLLGIIHYDKWYTSSTFLGLGLFIAALQLLKVRLSRYYVAYLFILAPFFIVNGILTGSWIDEPVVWYNNEESLNLRIGSIPIEDVFYGMLLIFMNLSIFQWIQKRGNKKMGAL